MPTPDSNATSKRMVLIAPRGRGLKTMQATAFALVAAARGERVLTISANEAQARKLGAGLPPEYVALWRRVYGEPE